MTTLPTDWTALMALVFLLGVKHGLDADHLATIDGLTRFNAGQRVRWARWCGLLFSLGHGSVVIVIALAVGGARGHWQPAAWVETLGIVVSVGCLLLLGLANLWSVWRTPADQLVRPVGLRSRWFARLQRSEHPLLIALVGALFALSFDTLSQAALFAVTGSQFGSTGHALALGLLFTLGMIVTDGLNGLWLARLLRRADARARRASRVLGATIGVLALAVAALGLMKLGLPAVEAWSQGRELTLGLALILVVALAYGMAVLAVSRNAAGAGLQR